MKPTHTTGDLNSSRPMEPIEAVAHDLRVYAERGALAITEDERRRGLSIFDQIEDAARWRFFVKANVSGSPEANAMDELAEALPDDEDLTPAVLQDLIDKARKQLACP